LNHIPDIDIDLLVVNFTEPATVCPG